MLRQIRHMALMDPVINVWLPGLKGQENVELKLAFSTAKSCVCVCACTREYTYILYTIAGVH